MRKKSIKIIRKRIEVIYCDKCRKKTDSVSSCISCDKEFCEKCASDMKGFFGEWMHDVCPHCWNRVKSLKKEYDRLRIEESRIADIACGRKSKPSAKKEKK